MYVWVEMHIRTSTKGIDGFGAKLRFVNHRLQSCIQYSHPVFKLKRAIGLPMLCFLEVVYLVGISSFKRIPISILHTSFYCGVYVAVDVYCRATYGFLGVIKLRYLNGLLLFGCCDVQFEP